MKGYISEVNVLDLQEGIQEIIDNTDSNEVKEYLEEILKLPKEEQEKWFLSSEQAAEILKEMDEGEPTRDFSKECKKIVEICRDIITVINVWDELKKAYKKVFKKEKKCQKKEVSTPCPKPDKPEKPNKPDKPEKSKSDKPNN